MNLLETKRLVRKIVELLHGEGEAALAPKLAQDFATACHAVIVRLNQCEAMISSNDRMQAVQLAETSPNLMGLLSTLEFHDVAAWRKYCREHELPLAETFDEHAVHELNECYARGLETDHPLYRDYRRAIVLKNDEAALTVLRTIERLNAADDNARSELARLDHKVLQERLAALGRLLDHGAPDEIAHAVDEIESGAFLSSPAGEVWSRAQAIRCDVLLDAVAADRESDDWRSALDRLDLIASLQRDWTFSLGAAAQARASEFGTWAENERSKDEQDRLFKSLLARLRHLVDLSEEKEIAARAVELPELKLDLEELQKTWRAIEQFARPVAEDLTARYRKRVALLQAEVSRRLRLRVRKIALGVAAALLLITGSAWMFQQYLKGRDFARQLQGAREKRLVRTAEKLLRHAQDTDRSLASKRGMPETLAETETFLKRELGLLEGFQNAARELPSNLAGLTGADPLKATQRRFAHATNLLAQLAPDLRAEVEPKLNVSLAAWARHLSERNAELNKSFESALRQAEQHANGISFGQLPAVARTNVTTLGAKLAQLKDEEQAFAGALNWRPELLQRAKELRDKHNDFAGELEKFDAAVSAMARARKVADFSNSVVALSRSEFSSAPEARAAGAVRDLEFSEELLLRSLLCSNDDTLWEQVRGSRSAPVSFVPKNVVPNEKEKFDDLKNDDAINPEHYRYELRRGGDPTFFRTWITQDKLTNSEQMWMKQRVYVPEESPLSFAFRTNEYGWFNRNYVLPGNQPVQVEPRGPCLETRSFFVLELPGLVALHNNTYRSPLLKILDELKIGREDSPLFRAYLFLRLADLMAVRREAWGVPFAPSLAADLQQLKNGGAGEVRSGDWYVPGRVERLKAPLQTVFDQMAGTFYWEQAQTVGRVFHATLKAGVRYAGFADADGKLQMGEPTLGEIWGWASGTRQPAVLAVSTPSGRKFLTPPLRCSPLFIFTEDRAALLAKAGVKPGDAINAALPVVFRTSAIPNQ